MSSEKNRLSGSLASRLAATCVLLIAPGVEAYAMGWLTVQHRYEVTTVEMHTDEVKRSAEQAAESGTVTREEAAKDNRENTSAADESPTEETSTQPESK